MPSLSPPAPRSRNRGKESKRVSERSWAELPLDALLCVFHKLDRADLMFGGPSMACRSSRQAARQPELWRYVDMRGHSRLNRTARLFAIPLSAGQCQWFLGDHYVDDDLLLYLAQHAPSLKSLCLIGSRHNSKPFAEALKKLPLLEELALSNCNFRHAWRALEFCPQLKHYIHIKQSVHPGIYPHIGRPHSHNMEAFAIARLPNLLSLQLSGDNLDNEGLSAILNNCPHLESLDLHSCPNIHMDSSLLVKCAQINNTKKLWRYALTDNRVHCWVDKHASSYDIN
ncbi:putative F-box/LRR-repeat protein 23 [Triticum aestivum]|uniref:putative F-box/LRR-repeat protein 23 n=1 Tax=Triticum aestivum TaxID=4565 RepID=UPI001D018886|nr:putative F-box/LRR-repeat protein 23 [Triticum aestivum]